MKEKDFQTKFSTWLKYHPYHGAFELKLTKAIYLPFSAVAEHQEIALLAAKHRQIVYKIPDEGISQKPFDCFKMKNQPAYVVIMFYRRGYKTFYMIDIDDWKELKEKSTRRSITEEVASEIGITCQLA